jgi:protein gp37
VRLRALGADDWFICCEPLLEPVQLDLCGISWVIVGGESGPRARHMPAEWARDVRDQCRAAGAALFVKQMARRDPIPDDPMIREFPA